MNLKRNIIFALESRKKNGIPIIENVPIRMRVIFSGKRIEFTTGYRIDVAKWDSAKERVINGSTNKLDQTASEINADLLRYYSEMQSVFKEFEVQNISPTPEQVKDAFNARINPVIDDEIKPDALNVDFKKAFNEFVKECGKQNNWTNSTYQKFSAIKNHLKSFKSELTFDYFDEKGLNNYVEFLRKNKNMRNSTIGKQLGFLKWFLRWSFKKGYNKNSAYDGFKPKLKNSPKKVIFLTWDELTQLREYQIPEQKQYLERVRDVFLFCCFTGLRYSDVFNLRRSDIKDNHIEVTTVKTADSLIIELNNHSKSILNKYGILRQQVCDAMGEIDEDLVALCVPFGVVDLLEVVDIHDDDAVGQPFCGRRDLIDVTIEGGAVGQAGERVFVGDGQQHLLFEDSFGAFLEEHQRVGEEDDRRRHHRQMQDDRTVEDDVHRQEEHFGDD